MPDTTFVVSPTLCQPMPQSLDRVFRLKYGDPATTGPDPALRWRLRYFNPDDHYEALLDRLITPGSSWLDIGCGRNLFPSNRALSSELASRCGRLVGVDPDPTIHENPFVHERVNTKFDDFVASETFDVISMRMVAEHVEDPDRLLESLARATHPGSVVVVYTVNGFSPIPLLTRITPFDLRHPLKKWLWNTDSKDTFPTCYKMNTRRRLMRQFARYGFDELCFAYLDDCRTFSAVGWLYRLELKAWKMLKSVSITYPENCLLGVYRRKT